MAFFSEFGNELARNSENPPNSLTQFSSLKNTFKMSLKCKMHDGNKS